MRRIALVTDFGTRDPYVASMKGVIASLCEAPVDDLTHEIRPFDIFEAAWFLRTTVAWWPAGTIFVAVVDPGVGSARKIVAAEGDGKVFLAPDNGVLTFTGAASFVSVENDSLFLPGGSRTFHGRDRFAPVAAAIARGVTLDDLGPALTEPVRLDYTAPRYGEREAAGTIVACDRFGNLITDLERARIGFAPLELRAGNIVIARTADTYADGGDGPFLITGSSGCIEISIANGSAADLLQLQRGERVKICRA